VSMYVRALENKNYLPISLELLIGSDGLAIADFLTQPIRVETFFEIVVQQTARLPIAHHPVAIR
jgi:hypothetical protein